MNKKILLTKEELVKFFDNFNIDKFSFDTETTSLRYDELEITGISFCDSNSACYIPIESTKNKTSNKYISSNEVFKILNQTVFKNESKDKTIIAHNLPFDGMVVSKYDAYLWNSKVLFDTMVASHLIDENRKSNGLKQLCEEELGIKATKFEEVSHNHYGKSFFNYGVDDSINTYKLALKFIKELKNKDLMNLMLKVESSFQKSLIEMKIEGVDIDINFMCDTMEELENKLIDIKIEMCKLLNITYYLQKDFTNKIVDVKCTYNFSSSQQLSDILFNKLKLKVIEETPTGKPKTGKITLKKYKNIPFVKKLNEYKICYKLLSAFFSPMKNHIQKDGRIRADFLDIGTKTGRLASKNPNLQQLPNINKNFPIETRKCFIAPEGYKMFSCDYSGQELRIMAHITDEENMIESFNNNLDLHLKVANDVWNLGISRDKLRNTHPEYSEIKSKYKDYRNKAKAVNFGLAYGIGAYGLSRSINCTKEEAEEIINSYFKNYSNIDKMIKYTHKEVKNNSFVRNIFGRYRNFFKNEEGYYPNACFRESFNFKIQGTAADMIRLASIKCFELSRINRKWGLKQLMTVHDEIVFKVKEEFVDDAVRGVKECFESAVKLKIPLIADVSIGDNYAEAK